MKKEIRKCVCCGKEFEYNYHGRRKYCSDECSKKYYRQHYFKIRAEKMREPQKTYTNILDWGHDYAEKQKQQTLEMLGGIKKVTDEERILKKAIDHYGVGNQIIVAMEELAELTQALFKVFSGEVGKHEINHIIEEMADVEIMLEQLKIIFKNGDFVKKAKDYRLKRLEERIDNENQDSTR